MLYPCRHHFARKAPAEHRVSRAADLRDPKRFKTMDLTFEVPAPVAAVWRLYLTANPLEIWNDLWGQIRAVHVPSKRRTLYPDDLATRWKRFEKGMKVFIDMAVVPLPRAPAMMVGLQIVRLDAARRTFEYRYLEGSPSYGKQVLSFKASRRDREVTIVTHRTWYRSHGAIVELLYPLYHDHMIRSMHRKVLAEL